MSNQMTVQPRTWPTHPEAARMYEPAAVILFDPRQPQNPRAARTYYVGAECTDLTEVPRDLFDDILNGMHDGQPPNGLLYTTTGIHDLSPFLQEVWRTSEAFALRDVTKTGQRYTTEGRAIQRDANDVIKAMWAEHLEGIL